MVADASSVFGGGSATTFFSATLSGGATDGQQAAKAVVDATKQEINRVRGYKVQLSPSENKRLNELQTEIGKLNAKAANGTIRADEIEDRSALFLEADTIIGKPSAGVENDDFLDGIREKIDDVLAPRLTPQQQDRLDTLNTLLTSFEERLSEDSTNTVSIRQVQNIQRQISAIDVPRQVTQLSVAERNEYDGLVEEANNHAGAKLLLNARESARVQALEETINRLGSLLPPDPASQPTASAVARAYARIG